MPGNFTGAAMIPQSDSSPQRLTGHPVAVLVQVGVPGGQVSFRPM